jgi:hypothetical protein
LRFIFRHCDVPYVRLIPQDLRALHLELFTVPSVCGLLTSPSRLTLVNSLLKFRTPNLKFWNIVINSAFVFITRDCRSKPQVRLAPLDHLFPLPSRSAGACAACHPCSKSPTRHSLGDGALQGVPAKANKYTFQGMGPTFFS